MGSEATPEVKQQRMKEFMSLLPLTIEVAGLPRCEPGKMFTPDQLDLRLTHIRNAYKLARNLLREVAEGG